MEALQYKLDAFEGPMDLLLHLVSQRKVQIEQVPIYSLIAQYLEIMEQLKNAALEVEAEFLEMAARLVLIKTTALLPKHKEEEEDPAETLRRELLDYRDCQLLAGQLRGCAVGFNYLARPAQAVPPDYTYRHTHKPRDLFGAYLAAIGKGKRRLPPPVEAFSGIIAQTIVAVASRYHFLLNRLRSLQKAPMVRLLEESGSRSEMVATFLAVLALVKAKRVTAYGGGTGAVLELQTREEMWRELESE
ncbi:MAG: segregation/condensation protein A [Oscillospiraceae bacterium]|jgi:segregation and condensation protein A|nr:segregation/condensation protein A [Oscillospiraceae bacterium]